MGKNKNQNKESVPNPTSIANRDILQRLNFLYQASVLLNNLAPTESIHPGDDKQPRIPPNAQATNTEQLSPPSCLQPSRKKKRKRRVVHVAELSRSYIETMKTVGQKTNVRMDPSVKRRMCKRCSAPLIPGVSATVRVKDSASHGHLISYRCHCCQAERRIPAPPILYMDPSTNGDPMEAQSAEVSTSSMPTITTGTGNVIHPEHRKKGPKPRLPPHFARDIGHVVFRGTEVLDTLHSNS